MRDELVELLRGTKVRLGGRALREESTAEKPRPRGSASAEAIVILCRGRLWEERRSA